MAIIDSDNMEAANPHVQSIADLAKLLADGQDANGNGTVEPIANEGGAQTVFYYSQRMADMPVLAGANRMPEPATPGGTSSTTSNEGNTEGH